MDEIGKKFEIKEISLRVDTTARVSASAEASR